LTLPERHGRDGGRLAEGRPLFKVSAQMRIEIAARLMRRIGSMASILLALPLILSAPATSAEVLRVGKAVPEAFSFVPLDIGVRSGFFKKYGIEIEASAYSSGGMLTQALTAGSVDIGLGSSPEMAAIVKGVPVKAVAATAGRPLLIGLMVRPDGAIKTIDDLKGRRIGVTSTNSLTAWLVAELSLHKGWGRDGIKVTPLGAIPGLLAALMMMQVDGFVADLSSLLRAEEAGEGKILYSFGDLEEDFHIHVVYATDKLIATRPAAVRGFLAGWFEAVAFMRANRTKTIEIAMKVLDVNQGIAERTYDTLMPMFSDDGRFNPKALSTVSRSYVDLKYLPAEPDMSKLYTEEFLPKSR
jgi:ABC-type nitrate/sulfonate/bicarbonate transport system substrate-binding protein